MKAPAVAFLPGVRVNLKQPHAYTSEAVVAAVSKSSICVQLQDLEETLLVFYHSDRGWWDGIGRMSTAGIVEITPLPQRQMRLIPHPFVATPMNKSRCASCGELQNSTIHI